MTRSGLPNLSRETNFSGANGDAMEILMFLVQLTTSRIGSNLTRLIHILLVTLVHSMLVRLRNPIESHEDFLSVQQIIMFQRTW